MDVLTPSPRFKRSHDDMANYDHVGALALLELATKRRKLIESEDDAPCVFSFPHLPDIQPQLSNNIESNTSYTLDSLCQDSFGGIVHYLSNPSDILALLLIGNHRIRRHLVPTVTALAFVRSPFRSLVAQFANLTRLEITTSTNCIAATPPIPRYYANLSHLTRLERLTMIAPIDDIPAFIYSLPANLQSLHIGHILPSRNQLSAIPFARFKSLQYLFLSPYAGAFANGMFADETKCGTLVLRHTGHLPQSLSCLSVIGNIVVSSAERCFLPNNIRYLVVDSLSGPARYLPAQLLTIHIRYSVDVTGWDDIVYPSPLLVRVSLTALTFNPDNNISVHRARFPSNVEQVTVYHMNSTIPSFGVCDYKNQFPQLKMLRVESSDSVGHHGMPLYYACPPTLQVLEMANAALDNHRLNCNIPPTLTALTVGSVKLDAKEVCQLLKQAPLLRLLVCGEMCVSSLGRALLEAHRTGPKRDTPLKIVERKAPPVLAYGVKINTKS